MIFPNKSVKGEQEELNRSLTPLGQTCRDLAWLEHLKWRTQDLPGGTRSHLKHCLSSG